MELYAAKRAGVHLTKVQGTSINKGEYLWVMLTDEVFPTPSAYEQCMRRRHQDQYTPYHYQVAKPGGEEAGAYASGSDGYLAGA